MVLGSSHSPALVPTLGENVPGKPREGPERVVRAIQHRMRANKRGETRPRRGSFAKSCSDRHDYDWCGKVSERVAKD